MMTASINSTMFAIDYSYQAVRTTSAHKNGTSLAENTSGFLRTESSL